MFEVHDVIRKSFRFCIIRKFHQLIMGGQEIPVNRDQHRS